jgi:hypothetical protein
MVGSDPPFSLERFFPRRLLDLITEVRVRRPGAVREHARRRRRRGGVAPSGRLAILGADHPARMVTEAPGRPFAMGNRAEYLGRAARAFIRSPLDAFMSTPDGVEDVLALDLLLVEAGAPSFLDERLLIGSVNRGGLPGSAWELDDRPTAYTPDGLLAMGLDAAKLLVRVDLADPRSIEMLCACARIVDACVERGLAVFVEPLPSGPPRPGDDPAKLTDDLVRLVGVASALGTSSLNTWLLGLYCPDFERVADATSLPIALLGDDPAADPAPLFDDYPSILAARGNVRGVMVGKDVLYAGGEDPLALAVALYGVVHHGWDGAAARRAGAAARGRDIDWLVERLGEAPAPGPGGGPHPPAC